MVSWRSGEVGDETAWQPVKDLEHAQEAVSCFNQRYPRKPHPKK